MKVFAVALTIGMLAACSSIGRSTAAKTAFDFGPPAERLAQGGEWPDLGLDVRAPGWFDSTGIAYRLGYANPAELRDYNESRWAGPPALLVAQRWRQRLGLPAAAGGRCTLQVAIEEFSQIFDTPEKSRGVLRALAVVTDRRGQALARTVIVAEAAAPSTDARGAVSALAAATDLAAERLNGWLGAAGRQGALSDCR